MFRYRFARVPRECMLFDNLERLAISDKPSALGIPYILPPTSYILLLGSYPNQFID